MAPRLIARSFAFLQPGGERRRRKASETDRDLARNTENLSTIRVRKDRCHSSRVKGAVISTAVGEKSELEPPATQMAVTPRRRRGPEASAHRVREPRTAGGNAGGAARCTAGGRLAQLVRALP
jgi:hypothetical protein